MEIKHCYTFLPSVKFRMSFGAAVRAVSRSRLRPTRAAVTLTPAAVTRVTELVTQHGQSVSTGPQHG